MGQCSTLPAEARASASVASRQNHYPEQRHRLKEDGRKESLDFNRLVDNDQLTRFQQQQAGATSTPQARDADHTREHANASDVPMDVEARDDIVAPIPPPLPDNATKQRCYKLNLDSEFIGLSSTQRQQLCLGPFSEPPPYLTCSSSEDSSIGVDNTTVAIKTAQIFRGITISRDGTILSQNARATRSNRGNKQKRSEKSRQATKIDKAKDLVEESVATGKSPGTDEPAKMVSLFIVGEYDDMKQLVRDGSKKLRDADGLSDDTLFAVNRSRGSMKSKKVDSSSTAASMLSPRKRASPNYVNSQRTAAMQHPDKLHHDMPPHSAPPKLKSHPRDNLSSMRKEDRRVKPQFCNDFVDPHRMTEGEEADWGHAWNIWNCGVVGAGSPVDNSNRNMTHNAPMFEGRESHYGAARENGPATRAL